MLVEQEFISLYNQHQNIVHKVCNLYMDSAADREDLFQEITLQAWKSYPNFKGKSAFSTWLYRVALNIAITFFKKEKRRPDATTIADLPEATAAPAEPIEEQVRAMYKAIGELSSIDKAIVMLYIEDYNYNDIGETLGITANNVAVKMNRIKTRLKEQAPKHFAGA